MHVRWHQFLVENDVAMEHRTIRVPCEAWDGPNANLFQSIVELLSRPARRVLEASNKTCNEPGTKAASMHNKFAISAQCG